MARRRSSALILAGDAETGVCIMEIEKGLDTGAVFARAATPIDDEETAGELRERLVALGTDLLVDTLPNIATITPEPQVGEPTSADKLTVEEFELDFSRPTEELVRVVRAGNPRPGAWTTVDGRRLKVWRARAGDDGSFEPLEVQPEGKARMSSDASEARPSRCARPVRLVTSSRLLALDALVRIEDGAYAQVLVPSMLRDSNLRDRDRAFATDLVYGTVRAQRRLDDLVTRAAKRPLHRLDPPVRAALRLGAYQLLHDVPRHAAVSETVDALAARSPRARGFGNAVLARAHEARSAVARTAERRGRALVSRLARRAACP